MKNLIKKNQLMITALAIMIAIAGYLQFAGNGLEEEYQKENNDNVEAVDASATGADTVAGDYTLDGILDLSEEDLMNSGVTEIDSLDSDMEDTLVDDYLGQDMQVSDAEGQSQNTDPGVQVAEATPDQGEIPGEAVFTSAGGTAVLSEAKLIKEQTRAKNKETLLEIINSAGLTDEQKQEAVDTMVEMTAIAEKEAAAEILLEAKGYKDVVVSINDGAVDVVVNATVLDDMMRAQIEDIVKRKTDIPAEHIIISTVVQ